MATAAVSTRRTWGPRATRRNPAASSAASSPSSRPPSGPTTARRSPKFFRLAMTEPAASPAGSATIVADDFVQPEAIRSARLEPRSIAIKRSRPHCLQASTTLRRSRVIAAVVPSATLRVVSRGTSRAAQFGQFFDHPLLPVAFGQGRGDREPLRRFGRSVLGTHCHDRAHDRCDRRGRSMSFLARRIAAPNPRPVPAGRGRGDETHPQGARPGRRREGIRCKTAQTRGFSCSVGGGVLLHSAHAK